MTTKQQHQNLHQQHQVLHQRNKDAAWERLIMIQAQLSSTPDSATTSGSLTTSIELLTKLSKKSYYG